MNIIFLIFKFIINNPTSSQPFERLVVLIWLGASIVRHLAIAIDDRAEHEFPSVTTTTLEPSGRSLFAHALLTAVNTAVHITQT